MNQPAFSHFTVTLTYNTNGASESRVVLARTAEEAAAKVRVSAEVTYAHSAYKPSYTVTAVPCGSSYDPRVVAPVAPKVCGHCGSLQPVGQSCGCFDNGCQ